MIPQQLNDEVSQLRLGGLAVEVTEAEGWLNVVIADYPIPPGFALSKTQLLVRLPPSYPNGKPDMFWTLPTLLLRDGKVPRNADQIENVLGKQWRRFSWHMAVWNPGQDGLRTFLEFVNVRLARPE